MNIEELSENLYDDLNGRILTVDYTDDLVIDFQCDDWNDPEVSRHFRIICHGVKETEILPCVSGEVEFTSSHQLLWSYNEQQGYLYYTSKPESRYELLGRIWEAHEKVLGEEPYINSIFGNTVKFSAHLQDQNKTSMHTMKPINKKYPIEIN